MIKLIVIRVGVNEVIYVKYSIQCLAHNTLDKWLLKLFLLLLTKTGNSIIKKFNHFKIYIFSVSINDTPEKKLLISVSEVPVRHLW